MTRVRFGVTIGILGALILSGSANAFAQTVDPPKRIQFNGPSLKLEATTAPRRSATRAEPPRPAPMPPPGTLAWRFDVHGGLGLTNMSLTGPTALPPAGASFVDFFNTGTTRQTSTWMVADGAVLFNQVMAGRTLTQRITPLDSVLTSASVKRKPGLNFGFNLQGRLTDQIGFEFGFDLEMSHLALTDTASQGVFATRDSFEAGFNGLFQSSTSISSETVTSTATVHDSVGSLMMIVGNIIYDLRKSGAMIPYVYGGGGIARATGGQPDFVLNGDYVVNANVTFREHDRVNVQYHVGSSPVGDVGGGLRKAITKTSGVQFDVRLLIGRVKETVQLSTSPTSGPQNAPLLSVLTLDLGNPPLQLSSLPNVKTNLGAPAISNLTTFSGSGSLLHTIVTAGYYWRF